MRESAETKWTPGKWFKESGTLRVLSDDPRATIIAVVSGAHSNPSAVADARLIAAAPALYAALDEMLKAHCIVFGEESCAEHAKAWAALHAARGEP